MHRLPRRAQMNCPLQKGFHEMSDTQESAEARRALLEKYLRGERPQSNKPGSITLPRLQARASNARERVIPVQTKGTKQPFFYLHGDWTGNASFCFHLAHYLGADQPFYILTP